MAETELEQRLQKQIDKLQVQINQLGSYTKRVHGQITHPSVLARVKNYVDTEISPGIFGGLVDYSTDSTIVGWSAFTTKQVYYKEFGDVVLVLVNLEGTSNSVLTSFTLPTNAVVALAAKQLWCKDNGLWRAVNGLVSVSISSNVFSCYLDGDLTPWTNSGQKTIQGQFFYRTA